MRTLIRSFYWVVPCFLIVLFSPQARAQEQGQAEMEAHVLRLIEAIETETDPYVLWDLFGEIGDLVYDYKEAGGEAFSPVVIDGIAELLEDEKDGIRGHTASILGLIGPAASDATWALVTALRLREYERAAEMLEMRKRSDRPVEVLLRGRSSEFRICLALHDIGTTPKSVNCMDGRYKQHPH